MKNLRKFETRAERDAWLASDEFVSPNVVLTDGQVEYNIFDPATIPLHIEALEDLTVTFGNTYEYSKDNITWASGDSSTLISTNAGEKVYFRAQVSFDSSAGPGSFNVSLGNCNVAGNIMSMVYGTDFVGKKATKKNYQFKGLFKSNSRIINANALILPATNLNTGCYTDMFNGCINLVTAPALPSTTLAADCYTRMFRECTSLVTAPELPATTLAYSCYAAMFYGCTSLNYIKMLATDISATHCLDSWVGSVASTGTFVKNAAATWDVIGKSGIPYGWTVETAES